MRKRCRSGRITIDISEVIDEIGDDDLLDEVRRRRLSCTHEGEATDLDIVREAYEAIQRGKLYEARAILERMLFPKWQKQEDCAAAYKKLL